MSFKSFQVNCKSQCLGIVIAAIACLSAQVSAEAGDEGFRPPQAPKQQEQQNPLNNSVEDTTIAYTAEFFAQYNPISARDMLDRIPGIDSIIGGGGGNKRGLGAGDDNLLINGKRIAGKENDSRSVLGQIAASQVAHIDIIRDVPPDMDVGGAGPVVNVVLREDAAGATITAEINADYYQQSGEVQPGAVISVNGRGARLNYLATLQSEPRYDQDYRREFSTLGNGSPKDQSFEDRTREQTDYKLSGTLGWQVSAADTVQLNALYERTDPPRTVERDIQVFDPNDYRYPLLNGRDSYQHRDNDDAERHKWEFGFNYVHDFAPGTEVKLIGVINEQQDDSVFTRLSNLSGDYSSILFIDDQRREREKILRGSFTKPLADNFDLEVGVEGALTTLDSNFILGSTVGWNASARTGNLRGGADEESEVKEVRYEPFIVSNWRPTKKLSIEASLVSEISEITLDAKRMVDTDDDDIPEMQSVYKQDDYQYWKPKLDLRYDISALLQFRTTINRDISQLNFRDYTTRPDSGDLEANVDAGNPELVQEKSWQYEFNLEYRLPNDGGVLEGRIFYHDIEDVIDRVDASYIGADPVTNTTGLITSSAPGNIGDGEKMGLELDSSLRMGFLNLPDALLTAGVLVQDSKVMDPFILEERRLGMNSRGNWNLGWRHDLTHWNASYGFNYKYYLRGNNERVDVDDIREFERDAATSVFLEKVAFNGIRFRLDLNNLLDGSRCLLRTRYFGYTADGVVEEVEDSCISPGRKVALKMRTTF